jgi:hypothetical protein
MSPKLLPQDSHSLIYILGEFQSIWRPPSSGLNLLGFQSSSGAHHSMEILDLQRLRGILEIRASGLFLPSPDLYSWRVSNHLEISFIRVKPTRVSVIQWGTPFSGEFRSMEFESGFGNLDIWVFLPVARSIIWHISRDDWTLLVAGQNYSGLQHSIMMWHFPAWRLSISTAQICLI